MNSHMVYRELRRKDKEDEISFLTFGGMPIVHCRPDAERMLLAAIVCRHTDARTGRCSPGGSHERPSAYSHTSHVDTQPHVHP